MKSGTGIFLQEDFEGWPHNWPPLLKQGGGLQFGLLICHSLIWGEDRFMGGFRSHLKQGGPSDVTPETEGHIKLLWLPYIRVLLDGRGTG